MTQDLLQERRGAFLWLTLNREERRNALAPPVVTALIDALDRARQDDGVRGIVITGAGGRAFCSGADLQDLDAGSARRSESAGAVGALLRQARALNVPLIARVNGACLGIGMALVAMSHLAVAHRAAVFGLPEVKLGMFPAQVLTILQGVLSHRALVRLSLTGQRITADEALGLGLVHYVDDDLDGKIEWLLECLLANSPNAMRRGMQMLRAVEGMSFEESLAYTGQAVASIAGSEDAREGRRAMLERRKPRWAEQNERQ